MNTPSILWLAAICGIALVVVFAGPIGSRLMRFVKWVKSFRKGD